MKAYLKLAMMAFIMAGISACQEDVVLCTLVYCVTDEGVENLPVAPVAAQEVLEDDNVETFEYDGIINRNIQNHLCTSVHHARAGRLDQAAHQLSQAKDKRLPALLERGRISQQQFDDLDAWMGNLTELLFDDMQAYGEVHKTFPFDCANVTDESEAISVIVETEVDPVDEPETETDPQVKDQFLRMVCYSAFATKEHRFVSAVDYLNSAINIAKEQHGLKNSSWIDTFYIIDGIARLRLRTICGVYRDDYNAL